MGGKRRPRRRPQKPVEAVLTVSGLGRRGDGLAEAGGKRVFVPFALAGETVRARISGDRAEVMELLEASGERAEPECRHFGRCGGCAVQHMTRPAYLEWKRGSVETALENRDVRVPVLPPIDAHGEGRRRVTLHVRRENGHILAGFMQTRRHRLIDLDRCPLLAPELESAPAIARDLFQALAVETGAFDVRLTATETGLDCDIRGGGGAELGLDARMALAECAERHDLARVSVAGDLVLERRPPQLTFGTARVTPPPGCFLQATAAGEAVLAGLVLDAAEGASRVADLYCGLGPFSLRLAAVCRVDAYDGDEAAIAALDRALRHARGLKPVAAEVRDLARNPLHESELNGFDAVVVDPPRTGAEAQTVELSRSRVKTVIAVSCNPATFARDAAILTQGGYRLEKVAPVDQFRYAGHVELVGVFVRQTL